MTSPSEPSPENPNLSASESPSQPQTNLEPTLPPEFQLPVDHLFQMDPQDLTLENYLALVQYFRNERLIFSKTENKPKAVRKSREAAIAGEEVKVNTDSIMSSFFSDLPKLGD